MKPKAIWVIALTVLVCFTSQQAAAQSAQSIAATSKTPKPKKNAPIDGGILLLLGAGGALGLYKARKQKRS